MSTVSALYMQQSELCIHKALVASTGTGEVNKKRYQWCQLEETIFHPKGGGQPADEGTIEGLRVAHVHKELFDKSRLDQFQVLHCFDERVILPFKAGDVVELIVDAPKRRLHSQLHTGGHLVAESVSEQFPELTPYQGNHYPYDAYVKFKMNNLLQEYAKEAIRQKAQAQIAHWIAEDRPVISQMSASGMRVVMITHEPAPCGGTHVASTKDVSTLEILDVSINKKEAIVTVKYRI